MTGDAGVGDGARLHRTSDESSTRFSIICAAADQAWAQWVGWQLAEAGFEVDLDAWRVPGTNKVHALDQAVRADGRTLVLLSPHVVEAPETLPGWDPAYLKDSAGNDRLLIPVVVEACEPKGLLASLVSISLAGLDEQEAQSALLDGIERASSGRAKPRFAPRFPGRGEDRRESHQPAYPGVRLPGELTDLLARVADAYREQLPGALVIRKASPDLLRYLEVETKRHAESAGAGAGEEQGRRERRMVGVWAGDVDDAVLTRFVEQVHEPFSRPDQWDESDLVYSGQLADELLPRRARRQYGVWVKSLQEAERGWDPTRYRTRQTQRLSVGTRDYPPDLYIPQRYVRFDEAPGTTPHPDVFTAIVDWFDAADPRLVLVLADFGHGKTFLTRELARRLPAELPRLTPMLINLRTYEKNHALDTVLAHHLQESGEYAVDLRSVRRMLARGQLLLIFDGFDELAARLTYDEAAEHLKMILSAVTGRAKVLVTSRTQHFASDRQWQKALDNPAERTQAPELTALGSQVDLVPARRIVRLAGFDDDQILAFLTRFYTHFPDAVDGTAGAPGGATARAEGAARRRLELLTGVTDLRGLSNTPRMLAFIAELPQTDLLAAQAADGTITQTDLYRLLVDRWLDFEASRRRPTLGALPGLTAGQLRTAVTAIALRLWISGESGLDLVGLTEVIDETLPALGAHRLDNTAQAVFEVGAGSLLVRDETDRFGFVHASVQEYLVADAIAGQLTASGVSPLAGAREMTALTVDFLIGAAGRAALQRWAERVLTPEYVADPAAETAREGRSSAATTRANALAVASRLSLRAAGLDLSGQDLRRVDLASLDLRRANLRGANLVGVRIADLDLTGADLRGANLTGAYLVRPRLIGALLAGSRWSRAALLDPVFDPATRGAPELALAAIPGRDPAESMLFPLTSNTQALAWSPDGALLAVATETQVVMVTANLDPIRILSGRAGRVREVAFSPDGRTLATRSGPGMVQLWDLLAGILVGDLGNAYGASAMVFSPDGNLLTTTSGDGVVRLWNPMVGGLVRELRGHVRGVAAAVYSPDGRTLVTGGDLVRLWNSENGGLLRELAGHAGGVRAVLFSPNGRLLVTAGGDRVVRLWDPVTGELVRELIDHARGVTGVVFSPDGRTLATAGGDGVVRLWDPAGGGQVGELKGQTGGARALMFSPDGRMLVTAGDKAARLWDTSTGGLARELKGDRYDVVAVGFSPDGRTLAAAGGDGVVRLWNPVIGHLVEDLVGHVGGVNSLAFSPDGKTLATAGNDVVRLRDLAAGGQIRELAGGDRQKGSPGGAQSIAFSPGGRILATAKDDAVVRLWNPVTGDLVEDLVGHVGGVNALTFSPDGRTLAVASNGVVRLWDPTTGDQAGRLIGEVGGARVVAFSPDGRTLVTGDYGVVLMWDLATGRQIRNLAGQVREVNAVMFSPDGGILATGGEGDAVRLWNPATGRLIRELKGHPAGVTAVAFSPDGRILATGGDGVVRLWYSDSGTPIAILVGLPEHSWAVLLPDGSYKLVGDSGGDLWWAVKLSRFAPGELDSFDTLVRRREPGEPLLRYPV